MTVFAGAQEVTGDTIIAKWGSRKAIYGSPSVTVTAVVDDPAPLEVPMIGGAVVDSNPGSLRTPLNNDLAGALAEELEGPAEDFFERMHVVPRSYLLGNVLSTQTVSTEVFNAWRRATRSWTAFANNGGAGISLLGSPGLPVDVVNLGSITGLNIEVTTVGPPTVNSTLDFTFDTSIVSPAIVFVRVVLFAITAPERPLKERLEFLTGIIAGKNGTEQRIRYRKNARQILPYEFFIEEGNERTLVDNFLFAQQGQAFGVPLWQEMTFLTSAASIGETVINVVDTDYADFRDAGFIVIYTDVDTNDVLEIASHTATTITVTNALTNDYPLRTRVMPLRICDSEPEAQITRYIRNLNRYGITFRTRDNDIDIEASPSWVSAYNSKIFISGYNWTRGPVGERIQREVMVLDSKSGQVFQGRVGNAGSHVSQLTFLAVGRQQIWELRQLLHALHGRQTSFYLPTNQDDFTVVNDPINTDNRLDVTNVGYTQFVDSAAPKDNIRVTFNDGSPDIITDVTLAVEQSATVETLTLGHTWTSTIAKATIARVEIVELVRLDNDTVEIEWDAGERIARCTVSVRAVIS